MNKTRLLLAGITLSAVAHAQCPRGGYRPPPPPAGGLVYTGGSEVVVPPPQPPAEAPPTGSGAPGPVLPGRPGTAAPRASGPRTPRGAPMVFTRGKSSARRLRLDWDVPVFPAARRSAQTAATPRPVARTAVIQLLSGKDRRPLLIMRECHQCAGSDMALLRRAGNNERTQLLTRWFHCVRLPATVRSADHPAHALFAGKNAPHLVFATADGGQTAELAGNLPVSAVWKSMTKILAASYKKNPSVAVKGMLRILDRLDTLDAEQQKLETQLEGALDDGGPKSSKFRKLKRKFEALQAVRKKLLVRETRLLDLGLK